MRTPPLDGLLLVQPGRCPVCNHDAIFSSAREYLREGLLCSVCQCLPRHRALMAVLGMTFPKWRELTIHESSPGGGASPFIRRQCRRYVASQYLPDEPPGTWKKDEGFIVEDLARQTFASGLFDLVITQDVFEHIAEPRLAIAEIARTLKPGGAHVCTVPLVRGALPTRRRARLEPDGSWTHLVQPPEYHVNPMSEEGSLVTVDWGYDIAAFFQRFGGLDTTIYVIDDMTRGIRADLIEVLVARKRAERDFCDVA